MSGSKTECKNEAASQNDILYTIDICMDSVEKVASTKNMNKKHVHQSVIYSITALTRSHPYSLVRSPDSYGQSVVARKARPTHRPSRHTQQSKAAQATRVAHQA